MDLHDEIARIAYQLWEKDGRVEGRDLDHWRAAEIMVASRLKEGSEIMVGAREPCETEESHGKAEARQRGRHAT